MFRGEGAFGKAILQLGREDVSKDLAASVIIVLLAAEAAQNSTPNEERLEDNQQQSESDEGVLDPQTQPGAKDAETTTTDSEEKEYIYGPEEDPKVNPDGSTNENTWTTPDEYESQEEAQDKLDMFKPAEGRREVTIPENSPVKRGKTPGHEGPYDGQGGANETLHEKGLPKGSVGPWKPLPKKDDII